MARTQPAAPSTLALSGDQYLDGICEKPAVACWTATWTECVPGSGAICVALVSSEQLHHVGMVKASRQYHIYPSNVTIRFLSA